MPDIFSKTVLLLLVAPVAAATRSTQSHHYFYFKESRPLQVDPTRVAILSSRPEVNEPTRRALADLGIEFADLRNVQVSGWKFASLPAALQVASEMEKTIGSVAAADVGYVSPVFVGNDGGPVVILPEILMQFESNLARVERRAVLAAAADLAIVDEDWANMPGAYRLRSSAQNGLDVLRVANELAQRPDVRYAEPNVLFTGRSDFIPNDTHFGIQWEHNNTGQSGGVPDVDMDSAEAWDITTGDPSILIVVIDNGVQQDHPDINQIAGMDLTGEGGGGGPVNACDNHGTPVAGCISATINNGLGTVGVAPACRSASARTFISTVPCDGSWSSFSSWTVDALAWAEAIGARVTNNSNYYGFTSAAIASKYASTRTAGMVHFASAGNDNVSSVTYPASLPSVMAIGAINRFGNKASFSNFGTNIDFTAPGDDVVSTDRTGNNGWVAGDYVIVDGTSFASPYSAGVAALALTVNPNLTALEVETLMQTTSVDRGLPGKDTTYGWGVVNAFNTVTYDACAIDPPTAEPDAVEKNRYISFRPGNTGTPAAIRVKLTELMRPLPANLSCCPAPDFSAFEGQYRWVGPLDTCTDSATYGTTFPCAVLQCAPHYEDWDPTGAGVVIHVTGSAVPPSSLFQVQMLAEGCDIQVESNFTQALALRTARWGDVGSPYQDRAAPFPAVQPNAMDIARVVDKVKDAPGALIKPRVQLQPGAPDPHVSLNAQDIGVVVNAVKGAAYSLPGPTACP